MSPSLEELAQEARRLSVRGAALEVLFFLASSPTCGGARVPSGFAFASQPRLARELGLGERTVREAIAKLDAVGLLAVAIGRDGQTARYRPKLASTPLLDDETPAASRRGHTHTPRQPAAGVTSAPRQPAAAHPGSQPPPTPAASRRPPRQPAAGVEEVDTSLRARLISESERDPEGDQNHTHSDAREDERDPAECPSIEAARAPSALERAQVEARKRELSRLRAAEDRPTPRADLDGAEHLEHLLSEAKRLLGATWANLGDIRDAWDGGGLRSLHGTVDKLKVILGWARAEEHPSTALTRALEGFRGDSFARRQGYTLKLFASEPSRYALSGGATSSAPGDFTTADEDPFGADIVAVLQDLYAKSYKANFNDTWQSGANVLRAIEETSAWCYAQPNPELAATRCIEGAFCTDRMLKNRVPWAWIAEDPAKYAAASTRPSTGGPPSRPAHELIPEADRSPLTPAEKAQLEAMGG